MKRYRANKMHSIKGSGPLLTFVDSLGPDKTKRYTYYWSEVVLDDDSIEALRHLIHPSVGDGRIESLVPFYLPRGHFYSVHDNPCAHMIISALNGEQFACDSNDMRAEVEQFLVLFEAWRISRKTAFQYRVAKYMQRFAAQPQRCITSIKRFAFDDDSYTKSNAGMCLRLAQASASMEVYQAARLFACCMYYRKTYKKERGVHEIKRTRIRTRDVAEKQSKIRAWIDLYQCLDNFKYTMVGPEDLVVPHSIKPCEVRGSHLTIPELLEKFKAYCIENENHCYTAVLDMESTVRTLLWSHFTSTLYEVHHKGEFVRKGVQVLEIVRKQPLPQLDDIRHYFDEIEAFEYMPYQDRRKRMRANEVVVDPWRMEDTWTPHFASLPALENDPREERELEQALTLLVPEYATEN